MKTDVVELMNIAWKFAYAVNYNVSMDVDVEEYEMQKQKEFETWFNKQLNHDCLITT